MATTLSRCKSCDTLENLTCGEILDHNKLCTLCRTTPVGAVLAAKSADLTNTDLAKLMIQLTHEIISRR